MIRGQVNTAQTVKPFSIPPPVGGLNGRDPLAAMPSTDAYLMDNVLPLVGYVSARDGASANSSDNWLSGPVETLDVYAGADGDQMLAWADGKIYDMQTSPPTAIETGMTSSQAINAMFSNAADNSQHLISVTGFDTPKHYDGSAIADLTMTGITDVTSLNYVFAFKEALYFGARDTLGFYYLPVGQIQGALTYFDLAQVSRKGGYLLAISSFSAGDGGETPQDYIVFVTNKGECIVYAGTDPSSAADWMLVGRYFAPMPIGRKCVFSYNADLILITKEGALPLSLIRRTSDAQGAGVAGAAYGAITSKLGHFLSDLNVHAADYGWCGFTYSEKGLLIINVPLGGDPFSSYCQFAMNTTTNAWCRITGWNAICFCEFNDVLYFGDVNGAVWQTFNGILSDTIDGVGTAINIEIKTAYNFFGEPNGTVMPKHFQWCVFTCGFTSPSDLYIAFNTDFYEGDLALISDFTNSGSDVQNFKFMANRDGSCVSIHFKREALLGTSFDWYATQYVFEETRGVLL